MKDSDKFVNQCQTLARIEKIAGTSRVSVVVLAGKLEEMVSKGFWKQLREAEDLGFAGQICQNDIEIATEIPQELAARATGWRQLIRISNDDDPGEIGRPFRKRLEQGNPFRTNRETVAGTFNVATRKDAPVAAEQRRAHPEL